MDLDYLQKNHPSFVKYEFNSSDLQFLEEVKNKLLENSNSDNLMKLIAELPQERTDLAEVILIIFNRVRSVQSKS